MASYSLRGPDAAAFATQAISSRWGPDVVVGRELTATLVSPHLLHVFFASVAGF